MCQTYNGYTNYQTWAVSLWLDNEQYTNEYLNELANNETDYEYEFQKGYALQSFVEEMSYDHLGGRSGFGMFNDLLTHALANVNWDEIIETHKEEEV